jgi:hypothetical protein
MDRLHGRLRAMAAGPRPDLREELLRVYFVETGQRGLAARVGVPPVLELGVSARAGAELADWVGHAVRAAALCAAMPAVAFAISDEPGKLRLELSYRGRRPDGAALVGLADTETRLGPDDAVGLVRAFRIDQ